MRAILVAVDYTQELSICLPWNRHHFESVLVVTSPADEPNVRPVAEANGAGVFVTDAFYEGGAEFAKWKAMERGLDVLGRHGLLCVMDADVLWPRTLPPFEYRPGCLYTPLRRMCPHVPASVGEIPPEGIWSRWPIHRNVNEWASYSHIFHAQSEHLGPPPWYDTSWRHCGGADSFMQARFPRERKVRPPWECLHLGECGSNWCGRVTPRADGTVPEGAAARRQALREMIRKRRPGPDPYKAERLP